MNYDIYISKKYDGSLEFVSLVDDHYFHRRYFGYTKKQAQELFKEEIKKEENAHINTFYHSSFKD